MEILVFSECNRCFDQEKHRIVFILTLQAHLIRDFFRTTFDLSRDDAIIFSVSQ